MLNEITTCKPKRKISEKGFFIKEYVSISNVLLYNFNYLSPPVFYKLYSKSLLKLKFSDLISNSSSSNSHPNQTPTLILTSKFFVIFYFKI